MVGGQLDVKILGVLSNLNDFMILSVLGRGNSTRRGLLCLAQSLFEGATSPLCWGTCHKAHACLMESLELHQSMFGAADLHGHTATHRSPADMSKTSYDNEHS